MCVLLMIWKINFTWARFVLSQRDNVYTPRKDIKALMG